MKKVIATVASIAMVSAMSMSVSAADWSQCSYADNDPTSWKLISQDANGVTFTNSDTSPDICKARITLDKILKNSSDYSKIAKMEWTVTYTGVTPELVAEAGLAGGTYAVCINSTGYQIEPENTDEDDNYIWDKDTYSIVDSVEFSDEDVLTEDGEVVFMDWSFSNIGEQGVQVSISDLKIYDASGAEIEQLGYGEWVDPATLEEADAETEVESEEEEAAETEAEHEEESVAEEPEEVPVSDNIVKADNAETGNVTSTVAIGVFALAATAAVIAKRKM